MRKGIQMSVDMVTNNNVKLNHKDIKNNVSKRGRFSNDEWQEEARYILRHLDDPIILQGSVFCRLPGLEELAKDKYSDNTIPRGLALREVAMDSLRELESELDGCAGVAKLKRFIELTRQGMGVVKASRTLDISAEYGCRVLKRTLIELLAKKLISKLR